MLLHSLVSQLTKLPWESAILLCAATVSQQSKSASSRKSISLDHRLLEGGWRQTVPGNVQLSTESHPQPKEIGRNHGRYGYGEYKGLFISSTLLGQLFPIWLVGRPVLISFRQLIPSSRHARPKSAVLAHSSALCGAN